MSDPTRRSTGGVGLSPLLANVYELGRYPIRFDVVPGNGDPAFRADFSDLAYGGTSKHNRWSGDIIGNEALLQDLLPDIYARVIDRPYSVYTKKSTSFRSLWRYLSGLPDGLKVHRLADFQDYHGSLMLTDFRYYEEVVGIICSARLRHGLSVLHWPSIAQREDALIDIIDERVTRKIYRSIKDEVREVKARWDSTRKILGADPSNLTPDQQKLAQLFGMGDLFSKAQIEHLKGSDVPLPPTPINSKDRKIKHSPQGIASAEINRKIGNYHRWLLPSVFETSLFLLIFLVKTGWNLEAALRLDLRNWAAAHPLKDDLAVLKSFKRRGNSMQYAISRMGAEYHPYRLITYLAEVTRPLRAKASFLLEGLERDFATNPSAESQKRIAELRYLANTPWIYASFRAPDYIGAMFPWGHHNVPGQVLQAVIKKYDIRDPGRAAGGEAPLVSVKPSDFRDAWIGFSFANGGHSWLLALIAAGHKTADAIKAYLRARRWRAYGEGQVRRVQDAFWSEIRARRLVDPTILRILVEQGKISEEDRQRLDEKRLRTRQGTGCTDIRKPPRYIAPNHQTGNICEAQRCVLCWRALLFADSLDHLCRRMAELEYIIASTPWAATIQSSDIDELEVLAENLAPFDQDEVEAALQKWREEIKSGRHRPIEFVAYSGSPTSAAS